MKLIVCVCRGNIARSPVAEKIILAELQKKGLSDKYASISRGVQGTTVDPIPVQFPNITYYKDLYEDSKPTLEKFGVDLSSHTSRPIDKNIAKKATVIFAMDQKTRRALIILFPKQSEKIHLLSELVGKDTDIVDPEGITGKEKQEKIFSEIRETILQGFSKIISY